MLKYSFVIPTYRNKKLLKNSLEALNYQEGFPQEEFEVIVVDDGSDDDTWGFIEGVNRNYALRYLYLERNSSSCRSRTRNHGWRIAEGEIIVFLDADIIVKNTYLKELEKCFNMRKDIVVIGTRIMLPESISPENITSEIIRDGRLFEDYKFPISNTEYLEGRHYAFENLSYNMSLQRFPWLMVFSCNIAMPKTMLEEIQGFDEDFISWGAEDIDLGYRLSQKGKKIIVNSRLDVLHQYHPGPNAQSKESEDSINFFVKKHGAPFEDLPKGREFVIFYMQVSTKGKLFRDEGILAKFRSIKRRQNVKTYTFKRGDVLEEFKQRILKALEQENCEIIINDYTEDTDLDIWVQLLENSSWIPEYYPISKKITSKESFSLINQLVESAYAKRNT